VRVTRHMKFSPQGLKAPARGCSASLAGLLGWSLGVSAGPHSTHRILLIRLLRFLPHFAPIVFKISLAILISIFIHARGALPPQG